MAQLLQDANARKTKDPERALDIIKEALAMSISSENHYNQAKCYVLIGEINESIQEWDLAIENFDLAEAQLILIGKGYTNTEEYSRLLIGRGNAYAELEKYITAERNYGLVPKTKGNEKNKIDALLASALILKNEKNNTKAKNLLGEAKLLSKRASDYRLNDIQEIESDSLSITYSWGSNPGQEGNITSNDSLISNGQYSNTSNQISEYSQEKLDRSDYYIENNNPEQALEELQQAEKFVKEKGSTEDKIKVLENKAEFFNKLGEKEKELETYRQLDSLRVEGSDFKARKNVILKKQKSITSLSKDIELEEKTYEIAEKEERIKRQTLRNQRLVINTLLIVLLLVLIGAYFIYKNAKASKIANQLLALKSLRSQMNPHFIFNALNSVNSYIAKNDERAANKFLADFSKLMRLVLDNSHEDFITLETEREILALYLKLEHHRFRDKFEYSFDIDENINLETIGIPPMLVQPYIENAIWHGLRYKKEMGELKVAIQESTNNIIISIIDNGIGRNASLQEKTTHQKQHNSLGLKNIEQRLLLINKVYKLHYKTTVTDLNENGTGTKVEIMIPKKR